MLLLFTQVEVIYFTHEQTRIPRKGRPKQHPRHWSPRPRRQPDPVDRQGPAVVPQADRALPPGAERHAHQNLKYKRGDQRDHNSAGGVAVPRIGAGHDHPERGERELPGAADRPQEGEIGAQPDDRRQLQAGQRTQRRSRTLLIASTRPTIRLNISTGSEGGVVIYERVRRVEVPCFLIRIQMKDQNELDRGLRKSNRQRVPNQFYTEGINELKRAPRPARDPQPKQSRKRSILYQEDGDNSEEDAIDEERSELARDSNDWFPCRLPKTGQMMKVQFVLHQPDEPVVDKKKEEPAKTQKKADSTFDLLQLFQKAIKNVNEQVIHEKQPEAEPFLKQPKIKKEFSIAKQRRVEDIEGRITNVQLLADRMLIRHSKIGDTEVPTVTAGQMQSESTIDRSEVEQYRAQLMHSNLLGQISIFN